MKTEPEGAAEGVPKRLPAPQPHPVPRVTGVRRHGTESLRRCAAAPGPPGWERRPGLLTLQRRPGLSSAAAASASGLRSHLREAEARRGLTPKPSLLPCVGLGTGRREGVGANDPSGVRGGWCRSRKNLGGDKDNSVRKGRIGSAVRGKGGKPDAGKGRLKSGHGPYGLFSAGSRLKMNLHVRGACQSCGALGNSAVPETSGRPELNTAAQGPLAKSAHLTSSHLISSKSEVSIPPLTLLLERVG
ncbi:uncharacterized protein LOC118919067 [Manis pentadactyla]|uniref:uncharacterized protein LOC118919067 n=1 Tax=Manis pentadactyla TaxID=143292 RepID=UPI00255C5E87|nr:uncharacterized protein LOC118919067 [Manis pentadactyla]